MPREPGAPAILRQRNFALLLAGQAVSVLGDRMVVVALAFAVLEVGGPPSAVGLVLAAGMVPLVACLLVGGVVADRTSRRGVMVVADVVRLASQGASAALLIAGAADVWTLAVLAGVTGAATGFFMPASTALVTELVPSERLQEANGLRSTAMSIGEVAGPLAAGVLVAAAGAGPAIAIDAATFAVSAVLLALLRLPPRARSASASFVRELREGWDAFRTRTWLWTLVAFIAAGNMLWGAWGALGPVVAERELGGAAAWGAVFSAIGAGALAGGLLATRVRPRRPLVLVIVADIGFFSPLAFLAAGVPLAVLLAAAVVSGASLMLANSIWETTLQRHVPARALSRVSAYDWFGSFAFTPVGFAVWGPVGAALGLTTALWAAFALACASVLALLAVPDVRRLPPFPAGRDAAAPPARAARPAAEGG